MEKLPICFLIQWQVVLMNGSKILQGISGGGILYTGVLSVGYCLWHHVYRHYSQWRFVLWRFICGILSLRSKLGGAKNGTSFNNL